MKAKNTSKGNLNLESGAVAPGDSGEFTNKEFSFLSKIKRCEKVGDKAVKKPVKKSDSSRNSVHGLGDK